MYDVFMSDLHIGIDAETNLYQSDKHESGLKAILKHIQKNGENIRNVVILGDWLDLWMYKTNAAPKNIFSCETVRGDLLPTAEQIIKANPLIFQEQPDKSGDFVSCIRSIIGRFYYMNGNHDIGILQQEINSFVPKTLQEKKSIICCERSYAIDHIYGEHGHYFSMVCKPQEDGRLPFGYFMTRAAADAGVQKPGDVLGSLVKSTIEGDSFAKAMLKAIAKQMPESNFDYNDFNFVMPNSKKISAKEVIEMFPNNDTDFNLKEFVREDTVMGIDNLGLSANNLHREDPARKIILMGHTHAEKVYQYADIGWIYANTGFLCGEDENPASFLEVEVSGNIADSGVINEYKIGYDANGNPIINKMIKQQLKKGD